MFIFFKGYFLYKYGIEDTDKNIFVDIGFVGDLSYKYDSLYFHFSNGEFVLKMQQNNLCIKSCQDKSLLA